MTICLGKGCFIGILCMSSVYVYQFCPSFPFGFEGGMWDLIVLIPDHCLFKFLCFIFVIENKF